MGYTEAILTIDKSLEPHSSLHSDVVHMENIIPVNAAEDPFAIVTAHESNVLPIVTFTYEPQNTSPYHVGWEDLAGNAGPDAIDNIPPGWANYDPGEDGAGDVEGSDDEYGDDYDGGY